ncbi:hypothetical protein [Roseomonas marmotae]|uniref:Porin n=1 Tax=Roseomonas marmotae TaxID=2768161 RepID=A0ABS3KAS8_9PROT|nr:hypothetical protein [Roseomonas marmotae]MBO1074117.1 hypothetical protein [Roseomonas marmotae]QTI78899.1 hypothetical protein IAI58_14770 [Roseomonas marmotae]
MPDSQSLLPGRLAMAFCVALLPGMALGQEAFRFEDVEFEAELNLDHVGRAGSRSAFTELYVDKLELTGRFVLPAGFSIQGVFDFGRVDRPEDGSDRIFHAHAAWVDQLFLRWDAGPLRLFAGKIHPRFGFAWDRAPDIYGDDIADTYELTEKIGAGARLSLSDLTGTTERIGDHSLQIEVFHADTSALSSSLLARRWPVETALLDPLSGETVTDTRFAARNRRAFGGADNRRGYRSLVLSLEGEQVPLPWGRLTYNLGWSLRRAGLDSLEAGTAAAERGYVAGLAMEIELPREVVLQPLAEWVRQENADGIRGIRRDVVTLGAEVTRGPVSLSYVHAWLKDRGGEPESARLNTVSIAYELESLVPWLKGVDALIGWRHLLEEGETSDTIGAQIAWRF